MPTRTKTWIPGKNYCMILYKRMYVNQVLTCLTEWNVKLHTVDTEEDCVSARDTEAKGFHTDIGLKLCGLLTALHNAIRWSSCSSAKQFITIATIVTSYIWHASSRHVYSGDIIVNCWHVHFMCNVPINWLIDFFTAHQHGMLLLPRNVAK